MKFKLNAAPFLIGTGFLIVGISISSALSPKEGSKQNPYRNCRERGYVTCKAKVIESTPGHWGKRNLRLELANGEELYVANSQERLGKSEVTLQILVNRQEDGLGTDMKLIKVGD